MIETITTLPISPTEKPHIGLCLMPLLMELLGESLGLQKILALNIHGLKYDLNSPQSKKIEIAQSYLTSLNRLGISPDHIWRDDLNEFADFAQTALTDLLDRKVLRITKKSVVRCNCGKVEYLQEASNLSVRRQLFIEHKGVKTCKLCRSELHVQNKEVCLFHIQMKEHRAHSIPYFADGEFKNLVRSFVGIEYLVSRTRVTHFSLNLPGLKDFDIDPDFLWSLMLPYLHSKGYIVKFLVGSRKNMLACLTIGAVAQVFECKDPIFIFPPYFTGPKKSNVKTFGSIDQMIELYGKEVLKSFMISGLNWEIAEAVTNPAYLKYLKSRNPVLLNGAILSITPSNSDKITTLSGINLNKALRKG